MCHKYDFTGKCHRTMNYFTLLYSLITHKSGFYDAEFHGQIGYLFSTDNFWKLSNYNLIFMPDLENSIFNTFGFLPFSIVMNGHHIACLFWFWVSLTQEIDNLRLTIGMPSHDCYCMTKAGWSIYPNFLWLLLLLLYTSISLISTNS